MVLSPFTKEMDGDTTVRHWTGLTTSQLEAGCLGGGMSVVGPVGAAGLPTWVFAPLLHHRDSRK